MENQKKHGMKILKCILTAMMIASFIFFFFGEKFFPKENFAERGNCKKYDADWVQVMSDGARKPIEVPGNCAAERAEWVTISTTLASNQADTWMCVRSMQQELRIFVGDALRKEYSTLETQPFGKTSTMTYVFFPIYESDAGRELRIEFMSDSNYSGYVSEIYEGDLINIKEFFNDQYAPSAVVAALMLVIGIFVVFCCLFVRIFYKRKLDVIHLGNVIIIASTWLLVESKIRQFIFPNSTIAMLMGFLMVALLPYPFLSYVNSVQKERYQKAFMIIGVCTAINFVMVVGLQVLNIMDFFETMMLSHIVILALIATMAVTFVLDVIRGYAQEYREVGVGFALLMVAGVFEIAITYMIDVAVNGICLCIGLVVLLFSAGLKSIRDLLNSEKEKQIAIATSQSKAKFLANMSHEIRTPINTVIGMNEMILRENKDETIAEYATNIKNASQMLLGLINDVLDFSKIEAGKLQIINGDYLLGNMLNDVIQWSRERVEQKGLEFKLDIDESLPAVLRGDEIRNKQILNNLLSNAIKYTDKGNVKLSVKGSYNVKGFSLLISVADTGKGIRKEDLAQLFDSFKRLELAKNRYIEGTGLGLNITQQLVNAMNGTIEVQSIYGEGSCFTVEIPQEIVKDTVMGKLDEKQHVAAETQQKSIFCAPDAKVLVVDDNKMNLKVVEALLKQSEIQMDFASGGNECFSMTKEKKYDIILMDHMMPEPDGVQTLHMIRDDIANPNQKTPIIVLTANAIEGMREQYLAEGFDNFLSKPIILEELERMLSEHLIGDLKVKEQERAYISGKNESLPEISEFDFEYAKGILKSEKVLKKLLVEFDTSLKAAYERLSLLYDTIVQEESLSNYRTEVHALKSTSATVGALLLSKLARMLEVAAIEKDMERIDALHPILLDEINKHRDRLKVIFPMEEKPEAGSAQFAYFEMLRTSLENNNYDTADFVCNEIDKYRYADDIQPLVEDLLYKVSNFKLQEAIKIIDTIKKL